MKKKVRLQIWDSTGQERFREESRTNYGAKHGFLVLFDLNDVASFVSVEGWIKEIHRYAGVGVQIVVIGTKLDFLPRDVDYDQAKEFCDSLHIPYIETSSKQGDNVDSAFALMTFLIHNNPHEFQPSIQTRLPNSPNVDKPKSSGCLVM